MRIELPGDGWAEIRPVEELKGGDKVAVERAIQFVPNSDDGTPSTVSAGMVEDMQMALLCRVITAWSYDDKPVTPAQLEDLPIAVYNALSEATTPHMEAVRVVPNRRTPSA